MYAVEFHPEVHHTARGREVLERFVSEVAGIKPNWFPGSFIEQTIQKVREQVGDHNALCALSGGVDSAVAATLVGRALGDRLTCVFVDNGLLRKDEFAESQRQTAGASSSEGEGRGCNRAISHSPGWRH